MSSALIALALTLAAAEPPASALTEPAPPVVEETSKAGVYGRTRTVMLIATEPVVERVSSGRPRVISRRVAPIVQELTLDADTGVEGLTIAIDAWGAVDAGERFLSDRALADITEGWLRWKKKSFTVTAGRLQNFSAVGRGLRFDGGMLAIHPKLGFWGTQLELTAYAGAPVTPRFGEEPLLSHDPAVPDDALEVAPGGTDWERHGDSAFGAQLAFGNRDYAFGSVGWARSTRVSDVDREALVADLMLRPLRALTLSGFLSYDLFARGLEDSEVVLAAWPWKSLRLSAYGRSREPVLLLPSTSILSVFGGAGHREAGFGLDVFFSTVRLSAAGEVRRTEPPAGEAPEEEGGRGASNAPFGSLEIVGKVPGYQGARMRIGAQALGAAEMPGYALARVGAELPIAGPLSMSAELAGLLAFEPGKFDESGKGGRGSLAAVLSGERWRAVLAVRATRSPALSSTVVEGGTGSTDDIAILGRFEWNAGTSF